jgi:hypothetical protein
LNLFQNPKYLKINDNRPVSFIHTSAFFGERFAAHLHKLNSACTNAGLGEPYLADTGSDFKSSEQYNFDALTNYGPTSAPGYQSGHRCFADMAEFDKSRIKVDTRTKDGFIQHIPGVSPVMDPRPLPYYDKVMNNWGPYNVWFDTPTYKEWEEHLKYFYDNIKRYPGRYSDPGMILVYAWNELVEGGAGIVPTKQFGSMFLDAVKAVKSGKYPDEYFEEFGCDNLQLIKSGQWTTDGPSKDNMGNFNNCHAYTNESGAYLEINRKCVEFEIFSPVNTDCCEVEIYINNMEFPVNTVEVINSSKPHNLIINMSLNNEVIYNIRIVVVRNTFMFDSIKLRCIRQRNE